MVTRQAGCLLHKTRRIGVAALAALALAACSPQGDDAPPAIPQVKTFVVPDAEDAFGTSFTFKAEPYREVNIAFERGGILDSLPVKVGDRLDTGDLIASLDRQALRLNLDAARAEARRLGAEAKRLGDLLAKNYVSPSQFDSVDAAREAAVSRVGLLEKDLRDAVLTAPFAGEIAAVYVDNHLSIAPSQPIARLVDLSKLGMWVDVPEHIVVLHKEKMEYRAEAVFDIHPDERFPVTIDEIGPEASRVTGTFPVRLVMVQPADKRLLAGMSGRLYVSAANESLGLAPAYPLPASALVYLPGAPQGAVWKIDNDHLVISPVVIREISQERVLVTEGVTSGDEIVISASGSFREGQHVARLPVEDARQ